MGVATDFGMSSPDSTLSTYGNTASASPLGVSDASPNRTPSWIDLTLTGPQLLPLTIMPSLLTPTGSPACCAARMMAVACNPDIPYAAWIPPWSSYEASNCEATLCVWIGSQLPSSTATSS